MLHPLTHREIPRLIVQDDAQRRARLLGASTRAVEYEPALPACEDDADREVAIKSRAYARGARYEVGGRVAGVGAGDSVGAGVWLAVVGLGVTRKQPV